MNRLICLLLIALLVVGCGADQGTIIVTSTPAATPDKPQETMWPTNTPVIVLPTVATDDGYPPGCTLPGDEFEILNKNPCLVGGSRSMENDVPQFVPEGYTLYSVALDGDGLDTHSLHTPILGIADGWNMVYEFPSMARAGEWGFTTEELHLRSGCYGVHMTGVSWIYDTIPEQFEGYQLAVILSLADGTVIRFDGQPLIENEITYSNFDKLFTFHVEAPRSLQVTGAVVMRWANGGEGSYVDLDTIAVVESPDGYCLGDVPEI